MARPVDPASIAAAVEALAKHGTRVAAAKALGVPVTTLKHRLEIAEREGVATEVEPLPRASLARLGKIAELLERSGIGIEEVGRVERVNLWQGFQTGEDGEPQVVDLAGIQLSPKWADGPSWPVVQPGPPVEIRHAERKSRPGAWRCAVILPDMQVGYFRSGETLVPTHDEGAIAVARQILREVQPDLLICVGDNLDLPEMGKYRLSPAFQRTTQAAVDRGTTLAAELTADTPGAERVWIAGNHEERLPRYLIDNAVAAFGLRRGNSPESWPVLSVPHLLRFDESGWTFAHGYPANEFWINDRLRVIHGNRVRSRGSTAHVYLGEERVSTIYGHVHRREWAERTRHTRHGPRTILAASPGCLARIDGAVPSAHAGMDHDGRPIELSEDWQQGLAIVHFEPGDGRFAYEQVAIHDGSAYWRGTEYAA